MAEGAVSRILGSKRALGSEEVPITAGERELLMAAFDKILQDEFGSDWEKYVIRGSESTSSTESRDMQSSLVGEDQSFVYFGEGHRNWQTYPWGAWQWMTTHFGRRAKSDTFWWQDVSATTLRTTMRDEVTPTKSNMVNNTHRCVVDGNFKGGWFPNIYNRYAKYEIWSPYINKTPTPGYWSHESTW